MSYLGLVKPICHSFLKNIKNPAVLEIGIDKGQTLLPMLQNLSLQHERFLYVGVDILVRDGLTTQIYQLDDINIIGPEPWGKKNILIEESNSLDWLPRINLEEGLKFDLVLLDGDHNYNTVSKELELLQRLIRPESLIVCDDFNGRWAERDLFYIEKEEYKNNNLATPKEESEKQGVGTAIRDFISKNENWDYVEILPFEPAILYRSDIWHRPQFSMIDSFNHIRNLRFSMHRLQPKGENSETDME